MVFKKTSIIRTLVTLGVAVGFLFMFLQRLSDDIDRVESYREGSAANTLKQFELRQMPLSIFREFNLPNLDNCPENSFRTFDRYSPNTFRQQQELIHNYFRTTICLSKTPQSLVQDRKTHLYRLRKLLI